RAGNITTQTTPQGTTTSTYKGNQLTGTTTAGVINKYWYDPLGRLSCITTAGDATSCTNKNPDGSESTAVITAYSYDFMDRFTAPPNRGNQPPGTPPAGVTNKYGYAPPGRLSCITTAGDATSCTNKNPDGSESTAVITAYSYDFMDRFTATHSYDAGTPTGD